MNSGKAQAKTVRLSPQNTKLVEITMQENRCSANDAINYLLNKYEEAVTYGRVLDELNNLHKKLNVLNQKATRGEMVTNSMLFGLGQIMSNEYVPLNMSKHSFLTNAEQEERQQVEAYFRNKSI